MSQETQPYKRSLAGSIGAGMGSLFGTTGKKYYILEHKISSKYHKVGEGQEIIIDQIEIGRDPKCQVQYDETFSTVSRRHAAIVRDGDNWKLVPLSQTNPTFLNKTKVQKEWFLQNGDEIQLATNGPKIGFIVPSGEKAKVGSIGLSRRLSLFQQQALRPYKTAITALSIFLLLAIGGGVGYGIWSHDDFDKKLAIAKKDLDDQKYKNDSIVVALAETKTNAEQLQREFDRLKSDVSNKPITPVHVGITTASDAEIERCIPSVYYIRVNKIEITWEGETAETDKISWSGTGFLLSDGRFVTARHVIEGWAFLSSPEDDMAQLNLIANNGGKVIAHFTAYSSNGDNFSFTSKQFTIDKSGDQAIPDEEGMTYIVASPDHRDWATMKVNKSGGLETDSNMSTSLQRNTKLTVLGFPLGLGANSSTDIQPVLGSGTTAGQGLNNGVILTTDTNYEQGNSGGPVFYTDAEGKLVVIGIVSAGAGRTLGFIVPIVNIQ